MGGTMPKMIIISFTFLNVCNIAICKRRKWHSHCIFGLVEEPVTSFSPPYTHVTFDLGCSVCALTVISDLRVRSFLHEVFTVAC